VTRPRAFTLLEAVIALVILTALIASVLSLRASAVAASIAVDTALAEQRVADRVLTLAIEGLLSSPEQTDRPPEPGLENHPPQLRWAGATDGLDWVCTRTFVLVERPTVPPPPGAEPEQTEDGDAEEAAPGMIPVALIELRCGDTTVRRHLLPER